MDPVFLLREQIDAAHSASIARHGGSHGLRSDHAIESALAAPMNDFFYGHADLFGIAAAYAFHIAEAQAFLDGNKRTAVAAALIFLDTNGIDTVRVGAYSLYEDMLAIASHQMTKSGLAERFRSLFASFDKQSP